MGFSLGILTDTGGNDFMGGANWGVGWIVVGDGEIEIGVDVGVTMGVGVGVTIAVGGWLFFPQAVSTTIATTHRRR